ncbi:MAG: regulatory protein RecX [Patescibacteria group bacterium]
MHMQQPSQEDYQHIKEKIVDYLSRQGFSEKKLLQKVTDLKKHYPQTERYRFYTPVHVQKVLDELKGLGLVDDYAFAQSIFRQLKDRKDGLYRIKEKMRRRLIPQSVIDTVLKEWKQSGQGQDYTAIIRETKRKYERLKERFPAPNQHYEIKQKLYMFLGQKGYVADEIKTIIGQALNEPPK